MLDAKTIVYQNNSSLPLEAFSKSLKRPWKHPEHKYKLYITLPNYGTPIELLSCWNFSWNFFEENNITIMSWKVQQ